MPVFRGKPGHRRLGKRLHFFAAVATALALAVSTNRSATALPKFDGPHVIVNIEGEVLDCPDFLEPQVELVRYTSISGYPIVGFTVKISAEQVKFHGKPVLPCGFPDYVAPLPAFRWSVESSPGDMAQLYDTSSLVPRLPLYAEGSYVVRLTVCPDGCTIQPPGAHLAPVDVPAPGLFIDVPIEALPEAPLGPETMPRVVPSESVGHSSPPDDQCAPGAGAIAKQWWAVRQIEGADDYRLIEGFVRGSRVSRKDDPLNHGWPSYYSQDTNYHIEPDPKYSDILFEDYESEHEPIEVEWERASIPERYRPTVGDRASIFGYWVTDCGHSRPEIHPPVGIAVHRPRPIRIPNNKTFPELGGQRAGTGIYVPGIITDMYFSTRGGDLVDCDTTTGMANAERVMTPSGPMPACVPAPSLKRGFEFDIYLPRNPQVTMREAGFNPPPVPLYIQSTAVTSGPAPTIEVRTDPAGVRTYLHVTLDLNNYTAPTYARRIAAGWVLPSPDNWGLARYKLRLLRLHVHDDGDGVDSGDGEWRLWVNTNNASNETLSRQEWVQILNRDVHGLENFGGRPWETGLPGQPGAPAADRSLGPDLLRYPPAVGQLIPGPRDYGILFHSTGYEADTLTDDDAGTILWSRVVPGAPPYSLLNQCQPQEQAGGLLYSGCVSYTAVVEAVPGPALAPAVLSQAAQNLADEYVLRCTGPLCKAPPLDAIVAAPLEATPVDPREVPFSFRRMGPREFTEFLPFEPGEREVSSLAGVSITNFYRDVRRAQKTDPRSLREVLEGLQSFFAARIADPATAKEALLDARILKLALPPGLWTKYFAGVPAPRPDPGATRVTFIGAGLLESPGVLLPSLVLHCAALRTPNSLSVLWERHRFDLGLVLDAACTDQPSPAGQLHTQRGTGVGYLDGVPGAAIEWTLVDAGEPGRNDTVSITIRNGDAAIVLAAAGRLAQGNLLVR